MAFRSGSYWDLEGTFGEPTSPAFPATLVTLDGKRLASGRDFDADTGRLARRTPTSRCSTRPARPRSPTRLEDQPFTVASVETRAHTERPKAPFITSTLQQEAGRKLGFSSARTMHVAQGLYERGLITYMRTDSTSLSAQAVSAARSQIRRMYGDDYLPDQPRQYRSKVKNAQEAHEAIRPAGDRMRTADDVARELSGTDERRLYDLIWKRTVASQMADARIRRVTLRLARHVHRRRGGRVPGDRPHHRVPRLPPRLRRGCRRSRRRARRPRGDPPAARGGRDASTCRELRPSGHTTQPPARYTEASLVKELEERGIGRPSTYASVIETILRARLRVQEGDRARPHVDRVRQGAAARALLRAPHRLRVHRDDGGGARRDRTRRGRSREVAPLLLLRQRPGRACATSWRRSTSRRSTRPRSTRCTSASTPTAASSSSASGPTVPTSSAATRRARCRPTSRPTS